MDKTGLVYDYFYEVLCNYTGIASRASRVFKTVDQNMISYKV